MSRHLVAPELLPALDRLPAMPPFARETLAERRALGLPLPPVPLTAAQAAVRMEAHRAPGRGGAPDVRVLVYRPAADAARASLPAVLFIHGGGYVVGTVEMGDAAHRAMVDRLGCVVASVDYRLAPETPWPGALEDCHAALVWLSGVAARFGTDPGRIAVMGESAGGGHAAALAILARDRGEAALCLQLLDSPMLDDRTGSAGDPHPHTGAYVWTAESNRFGWSALLGCVAGSEAVDPAAVPARAADLAGLPPACIVVGSLDLFVEEDMEFARRLIRAGVPTELHVIPGAYHGFAAIAADTAPALAQRALTDTALTRAWGRG